MLDQAFEALSKMDWGTDLAGLKPIDDAVASTHDQPQARGELEQRLVGVLGSGASRDAKDYVCRKLAIVGTAAAVPTLAALLPEANHSHMARYALERIPDAAAGQALRSSLEKVGGVLKIGIVGSLGARREVAAVSALGGLLAQADAALARAAALALGAIGTPEAVKALRLAVGTSTTAATPAMLDALLTCAENLLREKQASEALVIYKSLAGEGHSRLVRLAATRGMLACAGK